jgi:hypothetical protein
MSNNSRPVDGGRQRCVGCGHPRVEHKLERGCTVPKCQCVDYQLPDTENVSKRR